MKQNFIYIDLYEKMETLYIDKPFYEKGDFQLPTKMYFDQSITVQTMMFADANQFTKKISEYKEKGAQYLFIYEYVNEITNLYHPTQGSIPTPILWVRCCFKK